MKLINRLGILLSIVLVPHCFGQDVKLRRDAVECTPRAGLPNFIAKVDGGETVKIAYLGGSITAASGWRVQSRQWFQEQYPDAKFEEINAAIGGTGSELGVFRLGNDVLRSHPDLLFVEFAVNDQGASTERVQQAMEGIVRQTWKADPTIDICFVYTLSEPVLKDLAAGKMQRSASAMEDVADHYQIPSIHFGVKVFEMLSAGDLVFKAPKSEYVAEAKPMIFSSDGVHPHTETGQRLYADTIVRSWPAMRASSGKALPHQLVKSLRSDNWEHAKQVPVNDSMLVGKWQKLDHTNALAKRFQKNMPSIYQAMQPGAKLKFALNGTAVSVFQLLGPDGCELQVQVDDHKPKLKKCFDSYCTYHRLNQLYLAAGLEPGIHQFEITVTPTRLDKREILFERNRSDFDANPKSYDQQTWYVGSLLIIGDVVVKPVGGVEKGSGAENRE